MPLFRNKKAYENDVAEKAISLFEKSDTDSWAALDQMINRTTNQQPVLDEYNKIGDPVTINSTVYSAVEYISNNITRAPFKFYSPRSQELEITDHPIVKTFRFVNPYDSPYIMFKQIVQNLELQGKAFLVCDDFRAGVPRLLWVANSKLMSFEKDKRTGRITSFIYGAGSNKKHLDPEQVVYFRYPHPYDPFDGLAPITAARMGILLDYYANQYNINFFKNGAHIPGFVRKRQPRALTDDQKAELNRAWKESTHGMNNVGKIPTFTADVEYVNVGLSQKDIAFLQQLEHAEREILKVYKIPKALLGLTDTTFNNMKEAGRYFWTQTLLPKMELIANTLQTNLLDRYNIPLIGRFDTDEIQELADDRSTLAETNLKIAQTASMLVASGYDPDAVAEHLGLELRTTDEQARQAEFSRAIKQHERRKALEAEKALTEDPILQAAEQQKAANEMVNIERPIEKKLIKYWKTKFSSLMGAIKDTVKEQKNIEITEEQRRVILDWLERQNLEEEVFNEIAGDVINGYSRGVVRTFAGVGLSFNVPNRWAESHIANRKRKINTPKEVKEALLGFVREGQTIDELSKNISKELNLAESRSKLIARTEAAEAYNGGRLDGMKELGIKKKQWIHSNDGRVRPAHRINDIIPVHEPFHLNDGTTLMYPNGFNCRCTISSILDDEDMEELLRR